MTINRRELFTACAAALPALAATAEKRSPLGVVIHAFPVRTAVEGPRFTQPERFMSHALAIGAAGVQVGMGARSDADADRLRAQADSASLYLEAIVDLPRDPGGLARFEAEIRTAKRAGASVVRTTALKGRRYEVFDTLSAFRKAAEAAFESLRLAAPVVSRHGVLLAVENHKDWRAEELIGLLRRVGNDHVGVCLDTGNSIALLEDPMEVVDALAPLSFSTHIKDMACEEYADGFLLSEMPLGAGVLDVPRMVKTLRAARPEIRLVLEMITRDPLKVSCLTDRYWATLPDVPGRVLARALSSVHAHRPKAPLPRVSGLTPQARLKAEDENIRRCLDYARERWS